MPVAVPLAIVGSAVAGSAISASAAKSAAKTQANAANQASDTQLQMFNTIRNDLAPYRAEGAPALSAYNKLLGLDTGAAAGGTGTTAAPTVGSANWDAYIKANPDVASWIAAGNGDPNNPNATPAEKAAYQYQNSGQKEGRAVPTYTAQDVAAAQSGNQSHDWNSYLLQNPDVQRAWNTATPEQKAQLASQYGVTDAQGFAALHYKNNGQAEGRDPNAITSTEAALQAIPGYQFQRDQGIQAAQRSLGSKGLTGAQLKGVSRFVTGLADTTYGEQVSRLKDAANIGQSAANQTANYGTQTATQVGQNQIGAGTATASGTVGAANAVSGALSSIPSALLTSKLLGGGTSSFYSPTSSGSNYSSTVFPYGS